MAEERLDGQQIKKRMGGSRVIPSSSILDQGKLPPQAPELEGAVLGAIMIEQGAIDLMLEILTPDSFYSEKHQHIYRAMLFLYQENKPIDLLTVTEQLKQDNKLQLVGGAFYITQLTNRIASAAHIEYHARIIAQKYMQRELITLSTQILTDAYEDATDVFDLLDKAESGLFGLTQNNLKKSSVSIGDILMNQVNEIEERVKKAQEGDILTGVPSGFVDLDRVTSGWQKSDLVIMAARPGMGKTAMTLALARNAAVDHEKPVAFFSLEMSSNQLVQRLISMEAEISGDKLRKGTLEGHEWEQLTKKIDTLQHASIYIDDTPALNIFELRAKCRRLKSKHDIQLIIIDYLQLMSGSSADGKTSGNREQEISQISRSLKGLAKELDIPVIALSQLSRAVETRGGAKRPMLSDLRESGAIEQDADMVIFLYRPEYYQLTVDEDGNDVRGIGEVIISKHRNGELKTVKVRFIGKYAKFEDLETDFFTPLPNGLDLPPPNTVTIGSRMNDAMGGGGPTDENDTPPPF